MKRIALLVVAVASLCGSAALAQDFRIGVPGVGVTVDDGYRGDRYRERRDRDYRRSYNYDRDDAVIVRRKRDRDYDRRGGERVYIDRD